MDHLPDESVSFLTRKRPKVGTQLPKPPYVSDDDILDFTEFKDIKKMKKSGEESSVKSKKTVEEQSTAVSSQPEKKEQEGSSVKQFRPSFHWEGTSKEGKPFQGKGGNFGKVEQLKGLGVAKGVGEQGGSVISFKSPVSGVRVKGEKESQLWVDKYKPSSSADLMVHPKKVAEVKQWLQESLLGKHKMLVLTGPSGSGKTAVVRVLAKELGFTLSEWLNPVNLQWKQHDGTPTSGYVSRISQFRDFLYKSRGYADVTVGDKRRLMLVEDAPLLHDSSKRAQFGAIIGEYVNSPNSFPLVFILNQSIAPVEHLIPFDVLSKGTVHRISFNPVSATLLKKCVTAIAGLEKMEISPEALAAVCENSNGDLRHAINSLQFFLVGASRSNGAAKKKGKGKGPAKKEPGSVQSSLGSHDVTLSLFHALGKVLYNKRKVPQGNTSKEKQERGESEVVPEDVMESTTIDPVTFVGFLHENYLNFFEDVDDISGALDYLSSSDLLVRDYTHSNLLAPYASSVALRGLMYANVHAAPQRFQAFYKPQLSQISAASSENRRNLRLLYCEESDLCCNSNPAALNTEVLPYAKKIWGATGELQGTGLFSLLRSVTSYSAPYQTEKTMRTPRLDKDSVYRSEGNRGTEEQVADEIEDF